MAFQGNGGDREERVTQGPWRSPAASEKVSLSASGVPLHWQHKDRNKQRGVRGASDPPSIGGKGILEGVAMVSLRPGICNVIAACQTAISKWEKLCLRLQLFYERSVCVSACVRKRTTRCQKKQKTFYL